MNGYAVRRAVGWLFSLAFSVFIVVAVAKYFNHTDVCFELTNNFFGPGGLAAWTPVISTGDGNVYTPPNDTKKVCAPIKSRLAPQTFNLGVRSDRDEIDWTEAAGTDCTQMGCRVTIDEKDRSSTVYVEEVGDDRVLIHGLTIELTAFRILNVFGL